MWKKYLESNTIRNSSSNTSAFLEDTLTLKYTHTKILKVIHERTPSLTNISSSIE